MIGDVGRPLIGGWIVPISNNGGGPFGRGGKRPPGGGNSDPLGSGDSGTLGNQNPRPYIEGLTRPWIGPTWNPWYLSWYLVQFIITPNPSPSRKSLPYPIYTTRMDPNAHTYIFLQGH